MKCHSLRDAIVDLARLGDAGLGTRAAVESHLEHCAACASLMAREQQLSRGLRALAVATDDNAPEALERRLLEMFAERQSTMHQGGAPEVSRKADARWLGAAAALLVAAGSVAWWWGTRTDAPSTKQVAVPPVVRESQKPPASEPPAVLTALDSGPHAVLMSAGNRRPRATRQRPASAPAVVHPVGFVALPGAVGLPDFESGEIIRMEIPLTSLPTYGIEILPDAQGSPVEANLLVGQDGQARAIRLVTTSGSDEN